MSLPLAVASFEKDGPVEAEWQGKTAGSLALLVEEVEHNWFREAHPLAPDSWRDLLALAASGGEVDELLGRPAFADAINAIEERGRRRCLDPEVEDLLSLVAFLRLHRHDWIRLQW